MFASGSQLAQTRPTDTNAATAYTAALRSEITRMVIANVTASAATYSICHDDDGTTYDATTALFWEVSIPAHTTDMVDFGGIGGGVMVSPTGSIGVQSGTASAITYSFYGVTASQVGR